MKIIKVESTTSKVTFFEEKHCRVFRLFDLCHTVSLTKTNQSILNIPLEHLGPCLNCKFAGTS